MSHPANDTSHSEDGRENLLGKTNHLIDETTVEVEVGTSGLRALAMLHEALDTFLLDELQELVFLFASFLLCQQTSQLLQLYGTRIALGIDSMSDAIDESALVVGLAPKHAMQVSVESGPFSEPIPAAMLL